jgi:hypothetical protein
MLFGFCRRDFSGVLISREERIDVGLSTASLLDGIYFLIRQFVQVQARLQRSDEDRRIEKNEGKQNSGDMKARHRRCEWQVPGDYRATRVVERQHQVGVSR